MRLTLTLLSAFASIATVLAAPADTNAELHARTDTARAQGFDIGFNPDVDWSAVAARGTSFAYILATDSSGEFEVQEHRLLSSPHTVFIISKRRSTLPSTPNCCSERRADHWCIPRW